MSDKNGIQVTYTVRQGVTLTLTISEELVARAEETPQVPDGNPMSKEYQERYLLHLITKLANFIGGGYVAGITVQSCLLMLDQGVGKLATEQERILRSIQGDKRSHN